ncbi:GDT1-like protein 1 chloroplastic, partial [Trifolium medium]|nr:GDT1-like protein 1 chloroplastic [Trifolium medium]
AFLLIFFSELGDKTFFIAALLAARNSAGVVFVGTFGALAYV